MARPLWLVGVFLVVGLLLLLNDSANIGSDAPHIVPAAPTLGSGLLKAADARMPYAEQSPPLEQPPYEEPAPQQQSHKQHRHRRRDEPPPTSTAVEAAVSMPPRQRPHKECAAGCERNGGVCNAELGRCDCPPYIGGDACDKPLFAECAASVGLKALAPAPCVIDNMGASAPASCECLMGCEALGLMGRRECYVIDPKNDSVSKWVRTQVQIRGLAPNFEYWESSIKPAEAESVAQCSGHGVYAPRMPPSGAPGRNARKQCLCYPGWVGAKCETEMTRRPTEYCLNGCSGRGTCIRNWCQCRRGYWGVDCSSGDGADGDKVALPPPIGAQDLPRAPRVYIYDLPPRYNGWMHAGEVGWWQDMDLWGEDVIIHRRALRSAYRVEDPELADFFLVPVWDSSSMWQVGLRPAWGGRGGREGGRGGGRGSAPYGRAPSERAPSRPRRLQPTGGPPPPTPVAAHARRRPRPHASSQLTPLTPRLDATPRRR